MPDHVADDLRGSFYEKVRGISPEGRPAKLAMQRRMSLLT